MIVTILNIVQSLILIISTIIMLIERPGEGEQKREEAINGILTALDVLPIPGWVKVVLNKPIIGLLVDISVMIANKNGLFKKENYVTPEILPQ